MSIATSRPARRLVAFARSFMFYTFIACCIYSFSRCSTFDALIAGFAGALVELAITSVGHSITARRDSNNA